jgi:transcription elongation factor GreA
VSWYNEQIMRRYKSLPINLPVEKVEPIPLTAGFYAELKAKQHRLLQERKALQQRLKDAREMGDLSENGAYKYAKIELGSVGKQLQQLSFLLTNGSVATLSTDDKVGFGSKVVLASNGKQITYQILSEYEANPTAGSISLQSPLGALLVGKAAGDEVLLELSNKQVVYKIVSVGTV